MSINNRSDLEKLTTAEKVELASFMKTRDAIAYVYANGPYAVKARREDIEYSAHKELLDLRHENEKRDLAARKSGKEPTLLTKNERELHVKNGVVISTFRAKTQERNAFEQERDNNNAAIEALGGRASDTHGW